MKLMQEFFLHVKWKDWGMTQKRLNGQGFIPINPNPCQQQSQSMQAQLCAVELCLNSCSFGGSAPNLSPAQQLQVPSTAGFS